MCFFEAVSETSPMIGAENVQDRLIPGIVATRGVLILPYLRVCIEDFDPLRGHEQVHLGGGRGLGVGALRERRPPI